MYMHLEEYPYRLLAAPAAPDTNRISLDRRLAAERACVLCVLANFDLLDLLTEGRTVAGTVLACRAWMLVSNHASRRCKTLHNDKHTGNADFLRSFRHGAELDVRRITDILWSSAAVMCSMFAGEI